MKWINSLTIFLLLEWKLKMMAEANFWHPHFLQCEFYGNFHPLIKKMEEAHSINYSILMEEAKDFWK